MGAFYVGIGECGRVRAALVDDQDTTPAEVAQFARRQQRMKRTMRHVETDALDFTTARIGVGLSESLAGTHKEARNENHH